MQPSWRKPAGVLFILAFIAAYGALIAHFADALASLPFVVEMTLYAVLGIAWVFPLRPILRWMESGGSS